MDEWVYTAAVNVLAAVVLGWGLNRGEFWSRDSWYSTGTADNDVDLVLLEKAIREARERLEPLGEHDPPASADVIERVSADLEAFETVLERMLSSHGKRQGRAAWFQGAFWFALGVAVTVAIALLGG